MSDSNRGGAAKNGRVLIVDDDPVGRQALEFALESDFEVVVSSSGEDALEKIAASPFDLMLLDIEMPGIDGYETCRRLRENHAMPVIFISSHDTLEERLEAFDSGGDDFFSKPVDGEALVRKANLAIRRHADMAALKSEKESLQQMAMGFLRNLGETGVLLKFIRNGINCTEYDALAGKLMEAAKDFGISCVVQVRGPGGAVCTLVPNGPATPLEESIVNKSASLGRIFQFSKRLIVNYDFISILIMDMPADEEDAGRIRDNVSLLAESAEAVAETIAIRKKAGEHADVLSSATAQSYHAVGNLRETYRKQQMDTRLLLQKLADDVEKSFIYLGLTETQEQTLTSTIRAGSEQILNRFDMSEEFDKQFAALLDALQPSRGKLSE